MKKKLLFTCIGVCIFLSISISANGNASETENIDAVKEKIDVRAVPTEDGEMCVFITNNSDSVIDELDIQVNYKDDSDATIDLSKDGHDMIIPGSTVVSCLDAPDAYSDFETVVDIELGVNPTYENHAEDVDIKSNKGKDCIILEISNNSDVDIDELEYLAVLYKGTDIVNVTSATDVYDLVSGKTITEKINCYKVDFDTYEIYLNQAHTFGL